jgi:CRP-like cAMP-binding protein
VAAHLSFVKGGLVLMRQLGPDGVSRAVGLMGRGAVTGLLAATDTPCVLDLTAVTDVPVCQVSHAVLREQGLMDGRMWAVLADAHATGLTAVASWGQVVRVRQVSSRVATAVWQLTQIQASHRIQMPSHGVLAELLSLRRESVGRALGELERAGAVQRMGRFYLDVNLPVLMVQINRTRPGSFARLN